ASLALEEIRHEALRCFSCGECMACDNCWTLCPDNSVLKAQSSSNGPWHYLFDYDHCKGCGICAQECPVGFIAMVAET
ncbi:MAG TPA: 4Fe-4S binding protein, partial [Candidatus Binataceae bacterium]|nr:4Fe-4S binding protein [Candidatus Binataceae bacterium]